MELAHFTLTELPGTVSIWLAGVALGAALLARDLSRVRLPLLLIAAIAVTSMLGRELGWPDAVQIGLDVAFAAAAALSLSRLIRAPRGQAA